MSSECSQPSTPMTVKTDEEFLETMQKFPAIYDKSRKDHSNRDITNNGWKSIAQKLNIPIEEAKKWWTKLMRDYRNERNKQNLETRSGSGAIPKREQFPLYYAMKDMMMHSHATGSTYSNYMPASANNVPQQQYQQLQLQQPSNYTEGYCFKKVSGRSGRKALEVKEAIDRINHTVEYGRKILASQNESVNLMNANDVIGSIIQSELEQMDTNLRKKKIQQIHKLLSNHERLKASTEEH